MKRIICTNCGIQLEPKPTGLGDWPLEAMVAEDDDYRQSQLDAALAGLPYKHSLNMAANHPTVQVFP